MLVIPFSHEQILIATAVFLGLFLLLVFLFPKKKHRYPYVRSPSILIETEQRFYKALNAALKGRVIIMATVRIADIIKVHKSVPDESELYWQYFSKISQKHIDFVLVDKKTFATLCLIELDDISHLRPDRWKRDQFVNQVMEQANLPLFRFSVLPKRKRYNFSKLLEELNMQGIP